MIEKIKIENLTVFENLEINTNAPINVFIGENGTGKTQLLKFINLVFNSSFRSTDNQVNYISRIGRHGIFDMIKNQAEEHGNLAYTKLSFDKKDLFFKMEYKTDKPEPSWRLPVGLREGNLEQSNRLVFIPAKDMLTHSKGLPQLAEKYQIDFNNIYIDIINKAQIPELREIPKLAENILPKLVEIMDGKVEVDDNRFYIKKRDGKRISFELEAEGIKKIGLLWQLLMNGTITEGTILLWDEPETNLNPKLTSVIAEILLELSRNDVQIFLTTHSYFLAEYFDILENGENETIFHSLYKTENGVKCESSPKFSDLMNNLLIQETIDLYDKELEKVMG